MCLEDKMIRLTSLLEITDSDITRLLDKIRRKQFKLIGAGDNGRVYEIDDEDRCFKITKERDEFEVAQRIQNKWKQYTTFIPVYYVDTNQQMYIMANADPLPDADKREIDLFLKRFATYAREEGGEVSIFDFIDAGGDVATNAKLVNFLRALQQDVTRLNIPDFDLDLDFRADNVMIWNGNLVLVDW